MTTRDQAKQFAMECWEDAAHVTPNGLGDDVQSALARIIADRRLVGMGREAAGNVHLDTRVFKSDDTAFISPFGTVRQCIDCGALVAGGPTRCGRCAKGRPPDLVERFDTFSEAVPLSADEVAEILADEGVDAKAALARTLESIATEYSDAPSPVPAKKTVVCPTCSDRGRIASPRSISGFRSCPDCLGLARPQKASTIIDLGELARKEREQERDPTLVRADDGTLYSMEWPQSPDADDNDDPLIAWACQDGSIVCTLGVLTSRGFVTAPSEVAKCRAFVEKGPPKGSRPSYSGQLSTDGSTREGEPAGETEKPDSSAGGKTEEGAVLPEAHSGSPSGEPEPVLGHRWSYDPGESEVGIKSGWECHIGPIHLFTTDPSPHVDIRIDGTGTLDERLKRAMFAVQGALAASDRSPSRPSFIPESAGESQRSAYNKAYAGDGPDPWPGRTDGLRGKGEG